VAIYPRNTYQYCVVTFVTLDAEKIGAETGYKAGVVFECSVQKLRRFV
jgi:hypothetical protein